MTIRHYLNLHSVLIGMVLGALACHGYLRFWVYKGHYADVCTISRIGYDILASKSTNSIAPAYQDTFRQVLAKAREEYAKDPNKMRSEIEKQCYRMQELEQWLNQ